MNYLNFIEEYLETPAINQFEKINVLAQRAKDLYAGKTCLAEGMSGRKPTSQAQIEFKNGLLEPKIEKIIVEPTVAKEDEE
ncbi:MAG: DNA-directed RNA polymerase subunit omega [SAR324 cluster bacterium]|nr:DNA-directed RNA polymerase subunit omega [SAR324 cluster bacterium]